MRGFYIARNKAGAGLLLAFCLAACNFGVSLAVYTMEETCQYYSNGFIGDPSNCQAWGYCVGGELVNTGKCSDGFLFDIDAGRCDYATVVQPKCRSTVEDICAGTKDPQYVPDPNDCQGYAYCQNGNVSLQGACPFTQYYDPTKQECVWSQQYTKCAANNICRLVPNNKFVGDPETCGNYLRCASGNGGTSTPCQTDYGFDSLRGGCVPMADLNCPSVEPGTNAAFCKGLGSKYIPGKIFYSDGQTCYGYYTCETPTSSALWNACPLGTHFNGEKCVTPFTFQCQLDRCGNLNLPFVTAKNSQCKQYNNCVNGVTKNTQSCTDPLYPYFDEVKGFCINGDAPPNYKICQNSV